MSQEFDRFVRALEVPDFLGWSWSFSLADGGEAGHAVLVTKPNARIEVAFAEIRTSLGVEREHPDGESSLAFLLRHCEAIASGSRTCPRGLADFVAAQFGYFDLHLLPTTGAGLAAISRRPFPCADRAIALAYARNCVAEFLRNLWTRLRDDGELPRVTAQEAGQLARIATELTRRGERLAEVRLVAEALLRSNFDAETGDIRPPAAPHDGRPSGELPPEWLVDQDLRALLNHDKSPTPLVDLKRLWRAGRTTEAKALVLSNWQAFEGDAVSLTKCLPLAWNESERAIVARRLRALVEEPKTTPAIANIAALRLFAWGMELDAVEAHRAGGRLSGDGIAVYAEIMRLAPPPLLPSGEAMPFASGEALCVHEQPGSKHAILVIPGGERDTFGIPPELLHRHLRPRGCHLLYLHDRSGRYFLSGLPGIGDTHEETVRRLAAILRDMGVECVHVLGFSGYGFSAVTLAIDLEARSVLVYSPRTSMKSDVMERDRAARLAAFATRKVIPEARQDLVDMLASRPTRPSIVVRYGDGCAIDAMHAERLEGIEGVKLRRLENWNGHDSFNGAVLRGEFKDDIRELISG